MSRALENEGRGWGGLKQSQGPRGLSRDWRVCCRKGEGDKFSMKWKQRYGHWEYTSEISVSLPSWFEEGRLRPCAGGAKTAGWVCEGQEVKLRPN